MAPSGSRTDSIADVDEFARFYETNFRRTLGYVARKVLDPEIALDLTAEAFAQAFASRRAYRGSTSPEASAWLLRIAQTQVSRYFKRGRVEQRVLEQLGIEGPAISAELCREIEDFARLDEMRSVLRVELVGVSDGAGLALWLRVVEGWSYEEVAQQLGISIPTARARVARALRRLRERLESAGLNPIGET